MYGKSSPGSATFMPKKLASIVGIAMIRVIDVRNFMTWERELLRSASTSCLVPLMI